MATEQSEINELNREWRREISDSLKELRTQCYAITNQISDLKDKFALETDVVDLRERVDTLEKDKAKLVGAVVVLQLLGSVVIWVVDKLWH